MSIIDESYEEWSSGRDFLRSDKLEDVLVDNMVPLICESFSFRKEMFNGGLTASEFAQMRTKKKFKEKEGKNKNEKDPQAHILIANLLSSHLVDKFGSPHTDLYDELVSLEKRIDKSVDLKIEKLVPSINNSPRISPCNCAVTALPPNLALNLCFSGYLFLFHDIMFYVG